ncbi:MAG: autotransporter domain-containing protein [Phyllobacterium sp.]
MERLFLRKAFAKTSVRRQRKTRHFFYISTTSMLGLMALSDTGQAACDLTPTAGNSTYVCDSGTSAGLTDTTGNNTLTMPETGAGTISGNVIFGAGTDSLVIGAGTIGGNVQQGSGIDDFRMTGGTVGSLNQGDNLDTFFMSGGRIIDAFDDGDRAVMTGGRIGRVNMKLDDNLFDMSGGTIDRNLVTGFGNDTIILSDGTIGGNISVSGGTDSVTITGGSVDGNILLSFGTDRFTWNGGGIVYGTVDLGGDNDTAALSNLTDSNIGATTQLTGGLGTDSLALDNVKTGNVGRFINWEAIDLANDTQLVFDDTLLLGDSGTQTGTLTVDAASTLYGGDANGGIAAFTAGQLADVVNAGRIDLTNGGGSTSDTFTIAGNYTGNGGQLFLDTVLGDDSSASDKLVIDGGNASGTTGMNIINAGGTGDATTQDGILVVEALNSGTTASGAFALNNTVAAGAYEYFLFKGGVSANTEENWYLRSTLVSGTSAQPAPDPTEPEPPAPQPEEPETAPPPPPLEQPAAPLPVDPDDPDPEDTSPPVQPGDAAPVAPPAPPPADPADPPPPAPPVPSEAAPLPGPGSTPPTSGATPVIADVVPLYRVEVPTYSVALPALRQSALATLSTFHERRGAQEVLAPGDVASAAWARVFGESLEQGWGGTVSPSIDGTIWGLQTGLDILRRESDSGHRDTIGVFYGYASLDADIRGQALGWNNLKVGKIDADTHSAGAYWTHIGPENWYVDAVVMGSWFDGTAHSDRGIGIDLDGDGITASLEGGYPFVLNDNWTLEPQAQIIWQHISLDSQDDAFSNISFDADDGWTGRIGARLQGKYETSAGLSQPYVKANIWHSFDTSDTVRFGEDAIVTEGDTTSLELGAGIVHSFNKTVSAFAVADYTFDIDGGKREAFEGNIGLKLNW